MLTGWLAEDGRLFELGMPVGHLSVFVVADTFGGERTRDQIRGLNVRYPARFDEATGRLSVTQGTFRLAEIGGATATYRAAVDGWSSRARGTAARTTWGSVHASSDAILLVGMSTLHGTRQFIFLRRREMVGWRLRGSGIEIFCLCVSEKWGQPMEMGCLKLRSGEEEVIDDMVRGLPEVSDLRALESKHRVALPRIPSSAARTVSFAAVFLGLLTPVWMLPILFAVPRSWSSPLLYSSLAAAVIVPILGLIGVAASGHLKRRALRRREKLLSRWSAQLFPSVYPQLARELRLWAAERKVKLGLDYDTLPGLTRLEPHLTRPVLWPIAEQRYAAHLADVLATDPLLRPPPSWRLEPPYPLLEYRQAGISLDLIGYAQNRLAGKDPMPPDEKLREWRDLVLAGLRAARTPASRSAVTSLTE